MVSLNDLTNTRIQLPEPIDELVRFALVGRDKLAHVRAEIAAIDKIGLAKEVKDQKLKEAQAISEMVLDAEVRIGELMQEVPKATTNHKNLEIKPNVDFLKPKSQVIKEAGLKQHQVEKFQTLAKHPEIVEQAKATARKNGEILSRASVLKAIANSKGKKPDPVKQAEKEHQQYTLNKESGIVDINEAKRDKDNQILIQTNFIQDVIKLLNHVQNFSYKYEGTCNLWGNILTNEYQGDARMLIISQLEKCQMVFFEIQRSLQKGE